MVAGCFNKTPRKMAAKDDDSRSIHTKTLVTIPIRRTRIDVTAKTVVCYS